MASVTVQQNPIPDTSVVQPPLAQFSGGGAYGAISTTGGPYGVAQLGVDPNELTAYQLNQLYGGDSPIAHQAAQNAQQLALARGAGLSGSLYADTATQAALDSLAPIAQQDAGVYANTALANQDALNKAMLQRMQGDYSVRVAGIQAGPDAARVREMAREFDAQQANRLQDRQWQVADQDTAARANMRSTAFNTELSALFSDPSFWRDPQGGIGMLNTYSANIDSMLQSLFPEYYATDQQGNPVTP